MEMRKMIFGAMGTLMMMLWINPLSVEAMPVEDVVAQGLLEEGNSVRIIMRSDLEKVRDFTEDIEEHTDVIQKISEFNDAINPDLWANKEFTDIRTVKEDIDSVYKNELAGLIDSIQLFISLYHKADWFKEAAGTAVDQINTINKALANLYDEEYDKRYEEIEKALKLNDNSRKLMQDNQDWADTVNELLSQEEISEKDIQLGVLTGIIRLTNITGSLENIIAQNTNITLQKMLREDEERRYARNRTDVLSDPEGAKVSDNHRRELKAGYNW